MDGLAECMSCSNSLVCIASKRKSLGVCRECGAVNWCRVHNSDTRSFLITASEHAAIKEIAVRSLDAFSACSTVSTRFTLLWAGDNMARKGADALSREVTIIKTRATCRVCGRRS